MISGEWIPIVLFAAVPVTLIGYPIARAIARRIERGAQPDRTSHEVVARLERMEQAIDAMAVEMERVSEAQRFTTKLLSERQGEPRGSLRP